MHRTNRIDSLLGRAAFATSALAVLTLLMISSFATDAHAEHSYARDYFEIPDVARRSEADAQRQLEALGLTCRAEQVASQYPGQVISTYPAAGSWINRGREVVMHVGVPIRVQTIVPRIRRRNASDVISSLQDIYAITLNPVRGPRHHEGRVVAQYPHAGAQLPFRGLLRLDVVDNRTSVPLVEGLGLRRALKRLERAGLKADIREVPSRDVHRPTVVRQRPRPGSRVLFDTAIRIRVAVPVGHIDRHYGDRGHGHQGHGYDYDRDRPWWDRGRDRVRTPAISLPSVVGLDVSRARAALERMGLRVQTDARGRLGGSAIVRTQLPLAGTAVAPGSTVTLETGGRRIVGRSGISIR